MQLPRSMRNRSQPLSNTTCINADMMFLHLSSCIYCHLVTVDKACFQSHANACPWVNDMLSNAGSMELTHYSLMSCAPDTSIHCCLVHSLIRWWILFRGHKLPHCRILHTSTPLNQILGISYSIRFLAYHSLDHCQVEASMHTWTPAWCDTICSLLDTHN